MSLYNTPSPKSLISLRSFHRAGRKRLWPRAHAKSVDLCIHHLFEQQVQRTPQATAVITESEQFTYQQLNRQANRLAYQLSTLGVVPGDLVGICVEGSLDMVVGLLAIIKVGGAYISINPHEPAEQIAFTLQDAQIKVLLSQTQFEQTLVDCLPDISQICLDRDQWTKMRSCRDLETSVTAAHALCVVYSSGLLGQPRQLMLSHSDIYNQMYRKQGRLSLHTRDRNLPQVSFACDLSVCQILWPLLSGARLVIDPAKAEPASTADSEPDRAVVALTTAEGKDQQSDK